jgi:hypothetical protein
MTDSWIFPFFICRPDLSITVARPDHVFWGGKVYNINDEKDYVYLKNQFDYLLCSEVPSDSEIVNTYIKKEKTLFYVDRTELYSDPIILCELKRNMKN